MMKYVVPGLRIASGMSCLAAFFWLGRPGSFAYVLAEVLIPLVLLLTLDCFIVKTAREITIRQISKAVPN